MSSFLSSSWLNGEYLDLAGFKVCINSSLSFAVFESLHDDISYVFSGSEADDVINDIENIWEKNELKQDEAIDQWIRMHL